MNQMNDFTLDELSKEDLIKVKEAIEYSYRNLAPFDSPLLNKIQSMIDNYDAKVIHAWHCEKCGHVQ